jgi:hypothetical protein
MGFNRTAVRMSERLLIDAAAVAELFGLFDGQGHPRKAWVMREARAGRLPCVRLGKFVMFDPEVMKAWLAKQVDGVTG